MSKVPVTNEEHREKIWKWRNRAKPRSFGWIADRLNISRGRAYQQFVKIRAVKAREKALGYYEGITNVEDTDSG